MAGEDAELRIVLRVLGDELIKGMADVRTAVTGTTSQISSSFKSAESSVASSMGGIRERVTVGLSGVSAQIRAFGEYAAAAFAILAGERLVGNIIRSTQEWAFEVEHLSKLLGVSTEEASVYAVAAKESGIGVEAFDRAARGLIRTLSTKPEAFAHIGVDAAQLKTFPALLEGVLNRVDRYKEGIDRMAAAQSVFGGRVMPETLQGLRRWLDDLPHATEVAQAFGVVLGEQGVASAREFERATADLSLVALGFKEVLADALRPEMEAFIAKIIELGKDGTLKRWAEEAAATIKTLSADLVAFGRFLLEHEAVVRAAAAAWLTYRGALISVEVITAVTTALEGLQAAAAVGAALNGLGIAMGVAAGEAGLLAGAVTILTGGLNLIIPAIAAGTAALVTYEGWWHKLGEAIRFVYDLIAKGPSAAFAALPGTPGGDLGRPLAAHGESPEDALAGLNKETAGTEHFTPVDPTAAAAAFQSLMRLREGDLADVKHNAEARLAIEEAYAEKVINRFGVESVEREKQDLNVVKAREAAAEERQKISDLEGEHDVKNATKRLDEDAKVIETRRKLGLLSVEDAVAAETDLETRRYAIIRDGLQQRLDLLTADPNSDPVAKAKLGLDLEDAERDHQDRLTEILRKADEERVAAQKENAKIIGELFSGLGGAFNTALESAVDGTRSRADVMRSIWQGLLKDVLKIVEQIAATWAKQQVVGAITGTPTKATGGALSEQFSGALLGGAGKLFGIGGGTGADPRVATEQKVQTQLASIEQAGFLKRGIFAVAHYAKLGLLTAAHFAHEAALQAAALLKWIGAQAIRLSVYIATETGITAVTITETAARWAVQAAQIIKAIIAYAYQAASGAASAVASTPYVGPILAVINYGIVLAKVLAGVSAVSAEGGMEDTGPSPQLTVLHAREMVLPASIAETVRRAAATSPSTATGGEVHHHHHQITIHAVDAHSFEQLLRRKPHVIADIAARGAAARPARGRHP